MGEYGEDGRKSGDMGIISTSSASVGHPEAVNQGREGGREGGHTCGRQARGRMTSRRSCPGHAQSPRRTPSGRSGPPPLGRTGGDRGREGGGKGEVRQR